MIAAAIVCAAAFAQAATAKWTCNNAYAPGSSTDKAAGYAAYFIQSAALSLTDAQTALGKGDLASVIGSATAGASGALNNTGVGNVGGWGDFGNGETVTGYLLLVNTDSTKAYLSAEASGTTGGTGTAATIAIGNLAGTGSSPDTRNAANWYAIPEPTSGLLLLLGVAGLALKRRRA